jgi:RNA polymerase sigma-70 factor (ECF subfamily)
MERSDFSSIYADYKGMVWGLSSRYADRPADREDLFQEVFLNVHRSLNKFRGDSSLKTWIYKITVNTAINFLKKYNRYKKFRTVLNGFGFFEAADEVPEPPGDILLKPLEALNPQQRTILLLSDVEEKPLEEIAKILSIPLGTVKSNLHRARNIVKKEVEKNGEL